MLKTSIRRLANSLGYDVVSRDAGKLPDLRPYKQLCTAEELARKPFYNVGAGTFRHPYWTNVDNPSDWYQGQQQDQAMIAYDLMALAPLPLQDGAAKLVYTSHTMEHIPNRSAEYFYREAYRVLEPGGLLRVTVPDAELFYRAYLSGDRFLDNMVRIYATAEKAQRICLGIPAQELSRQQLFLWRIATSVTVHHTDGSPERMTDEEVDHVFSTMPLAAALDHCTAKCDPEVQKRNPGNHINWWNWDKLSEKLHQAGFSQVRRCGYGQSASPLMRDTRFFDNTHPEFSIYVEATK